MRIWSQIDDRWGGRYSLDTECVADAIIQQPWDLTLVPIIAVETYVLRDQLHLRIWRALSVAIGANMLSLLAGWIVVLLSLVAASVPDFLGLEVEVMPMVEEGTVANLLTLVLFVPFFYLSVWIELRFCRWRLREVGAGALRACVWRANIVSYTMLGVFVVARAVRIFGRFLVVG